MTKQQAFALVEAMIGWEDIAPDISKPNSPHCLTSLKSIMGVDKLPMVSTLYGVLRTLNISLIERDKIIDLANVLIDCGIYLRAAASPQMNEIQETTEG